MPSLLLVVFLLQVVIHVINSFGATLVNELLWSLYNKLPISTSVASQKSSVLKSDAMRLKREMNAVSAQDDFARWAKLRRQHDKALAEYEKSAANLASAKVQFDNAAKALRWLGTNGLRILLQFWFTKTAMFWLPRGWLPSYVEWALSFPRAPTGSISIQVWGIACASVVQLVHQAVVASCLLMTVRAHAAEANKGAAFVGAQQGTLGSARAGKKDL